MVRTISLLVVLVFLSSCNGSGSDSNSQTQTPPDSFAQLEISGTRYYIDPNGVDTAEGGTQENPWKSLSYACDMVDTSGDAIHVNVGTYIMTTQCHLAEGVSIEGEGDDSLIVSHLTDAWGPSIWLTSSSVGTDGSQHIYNLKIDGDDATAWTGVYVAARNNVYIHNVTFTNFFHSAAIFNGKVAMGDNSEPEQWTTGNQFYNNTVTNCSGWHLSDGYASGAVAIGSQDGMRVFNNTITQNSRTEGENGYLIKYFSNGYNKNLKIYNNTLVKAPTSNRSSDWNFAIEFWNSLGGFEIYENIIYGSIDIAGASGGSDVDYAWSVHDNTIGYSSFQTYNTGASNGGIFIEGEQTGGGYAYRNLFRFVGTPLQFYPHGNHTVEDIYIYNNIFNGIGTSTTGNWNNLTAWSVAQVTDQLPTIDDIYFVHNVVYAGGGDAARGFHLPDIGNATNVDVSNNIFLGFNYQPVYSNLDGNQTIDSLAIRNNIFYDNGINAQVFDGIAPTMTTISGNIESAPTFVAQGSDFHLQASSVGIDAGVHLDWISDDFENISVGNPPNIGCYEESH
ncbi:hypothetical protein [Sulfurimonas sp.]|uniref:hypothetical protein n=1 Tax=Sulfurimonas sp. TaxID=2022749 RepID=UPI003D09B3EA